MSTFRGPRLSWLLALACLMGSGTLGSDRHSPGADSPGKTAAKAAEHSAPCAAADAEPCTIRLRGPGAPGVSPACLVEPWSRYLDFTLPDRWADSNRDGWWETVLRIALDPVKECACAHFRVRFEDPVRDWTVDIGDSPTNNGYGGDDGTTPDAAEVQVLDRLLSVYSAVVPGTDAVEMLQDMRLPPLGGRQMEFVVCDQSLEVELPSPPGAADPIRFKLETSRSRLLFALADTAKNNRRGNDHAIYAAFNRVVHARSAAPDRERVGSGVKLVEISLTR